MTYAPATISALAAFYVKQGGVNLGIVGDSAHKAKGTSYHLGKSALAADAYSRYTARDKAGLTEAASAIDLGKLNGSLTHLRVFSGWFVSRCRADAPGTSDVREVIYTTNGTTVLRWDRERGYASDPRAGEADSSHLFHTHISFYRDSEKRSKTALFTPYFAVPDTSTQEDGVTIVVIEKFPEPRRFTAAGPLRRFSETEEIKPPIPAGYSATVDGTASITGNVSSPHGVGFYRLASGGSAGRYVLAAQVVLA